MDGEADLIMVKFGKSGAPLRRPARLIRRQSPGSLASSSGAKSSVSG